jgi:transcriptional regulator with XRE-family HTH domain
MSGSRDLVSEFRDREYREAYAEDYLYSFIAMQFQIVREQRGRTQQELADAISTKQTAISRLENINNRSRNLAFLQKAAFALGCRLRVSLETFGSLVGDEGPKFSRQALQRPSFEEDAVFKEPSQLATHVATRSNVILFPVTGQPQAQLKAQDDTAPFQHVLMFSDNAKQGDTQPKANQPYVNAA